MDSVSVPDPSPLNSSGLCESIRLSTITEPDPLMKQSWQPGVAVYCKRLIAGRWRHLNNVQW